MEKQHKKRGRFISFEGIEGVGKTTALQFVRDYLDNQQIAYVVTREPGGTPIAEAIRTVLLNHYDEEMCKDTELLLMFAGRAQNIAQVILPALQRGQWVLSDRFTDASFAYQGGGRGVAIQHIEELARWVQGDLRPDLTLLLDTPVEIGLNRVTSRGAKDRIEAEGVEFFQRVRETYLQLAKTHAQRFCIIDTNQALTDVKKQILNSVETLLKK
jgi:dTMP kinase